MNDMIVKNVDVMGDSIMAAEDKDKIIWVGVRWICDALDMTEGQMKRQITNIKKDVLFGKGGSNLIPLPTGQGMQEVFCIRNDFIPLWLAKITITEKTRAERPEFAEKLLDYQLKAKDILADAFIQKKSSVPATTAEQIKLLAQGHTELKEEIDCVKSDVDELKKELPLFPFEADLVMNAARKKGVSVMGGKQSKAYRNRSIAQKVYRNLYLALNMNFDVRTYKEIKRRYLEQAIESVEKWEPPIVLRDEILMENAK